MNNSSSHHSRRIVRRLLLIAAPLTFAVIVAGAYTRLSDAGLGCPDWPTCYGQLVGVPDAAAAAAHSPNAPLDKNKAWIEVAHRYIAGVLGLLLFAAAAWSLRVRPLPRAPLVLAILVCGQALLGMLTVTELLRPIVVSAHLLGGILIFTMIVYALTARDAPRSSVGLKAAALATTAILLIQIFLGGWVSANYAALSCPDFPRCLGGWQPPTIDWRGYVLARDLYVDADGAPLTAAALATIHWVHRVFAIIATAAIGGFGVLLWRTQARRRATILWSLLSLQIILGIINVVAGLPLWSALSHVAVAALLMATMGGNLAKLSWGRI